MAAFQAVTKSHDVIEFHSTHINDKFSWTPILVAMLFGWQAWYSQGYWSILWLCIGVFIETRLYISSGQRVKQEILTVMKDIGVQMTTVYYNGLQRRKFVEKDQIDAFIINEGISFPSIVTYLAFIVKDESNMVLPFAYLMPDTKNLVQIHRSTITMLGIS